jgi:hypothetical protein
VASKKYCTDDTNLKDTVMKEIKATSKSSLSVCSFVDGHINLDGVSKFELALTDSFVGIIRG